MAKEMLINVSEGEECRIALVENRRLEELYMERTSSTSHVGNIYKGRVTNVEPSIQAAFVDFGLGRNGFLHISDLMPTYFGKRGEDITESVGRKMARRDRPPIQRCLRRGDDIVVQIIKEGIGTKGPTLSTYLSVPGRILVMMPGMSKLGVSRKIEDEEERRRLRQILDSLKPPRDCGFIIRTAGIGKTKAEIQKDLQYLTRLWQNMDKKIKSGGGPYELYTEGDLVTRTVRDVVSADVERIIVDNKDVARRVKDFIKIALPRTKNKLELYEGTVPLFHKYGIEKEIEQMYSRHVPLPSGGSLVIDSTEAIVAIDVNSGKFRDHADAEMTAFKTDLEAADEIPRQLRLRDLGGVIICDFIDLRYERHRRELEKRLHENLKDDRAKTKMLRMSQFGIIEMTRQRMRPSLKRSIYFDCPNCKGAGLVKTPESMALDVMRRLAIAINDQRVARVELSVSPDVGFYLQNKKRASLAALETQFNKRIVIRTDATLGMDGMSLDLFDAREGLVFLEELGMVPPSALPLPGRAAMPLPQSRGGRREERRDRHRPQEQRGREQRRPERAARDLEEQEERFDIESVEDAVEEREERILEQASTAAAETLLPPPPPVEAGEVAEAPEPIEAEAAAPAQRAEPAPLPARVAASPAAAAPMEEDVRLARSHRGRRGQRRPSAGALPAQAAAASVAEQPSAAAEAEAPAQRPPVKAPTAAKTAPAEEVALVEVAAEAPAPTQEPAPAKRPRRRGTRGGTRTRRSKKQAESAEAAAETATVAVAAERPAAAAAAEPAVVRTGSTDRHLMHDEPILPPPAQRPRTYRDLDHIPDDFD